jgi:hypothetical protein
MSMLICNSITAFAEPQEDPCCIGRGCCGGGGCYEYTCYNNEDCLGSYYCGVKCCVVVEEHDSSGSTHGTTKDALVSDEDSFERDGVNDNGETTFYLDIDKDADSDKVVIKDNVSVPVDLDTGICHYDLEWTTERTAQIKATVPLYVCMYGYGGTGEVVTPADDAYYISNESTYSDIKKVTNITPYYKVTKIQSQDEYVTEDTINAYIDAIIENADFDLNDPEVLAEVNKEIEEFKASDEAAQYAYESYLDSLKSYLNIDKNAEFPEEYQSGTYGLYTSDYGANYTVIELSKCDQHDSDEGDSCKAGDYFIKGADVDEVKIGETTYKVYEDGDEKQGNPSFLTAANNAYLPLNVPTIKTDASWTLKSLSDIGTLKQKQIAMSINSLDLSKVDKGTSFGESHTLDISGLNWVVPAATKDYDTYKVTQGKLNLPIQAAIAGGNVNDEGCVPVVKVTYTVTPAYDDPSLNHKYGEIKTPPSDES